MKKYLLIILAFLLCNMINVNGLSLSEIKETPEEQLRAGVEINQKLYSNSSQEIKKIITSDNSFVVIGKSYISEEVYYPYAALYVDERLKWEKTFTEKGAGVVSDCVIDDEIYLSIESTRDYLNYVSLLKINTSGVVLIEKEYCGYEGITAIGIHVYQNWIMMFGTTWAKKGKFAVNNSISEFYIASFIKEDLSEGIIASYGNNGENLLLDYAATNGSIYLKVRVDGNGYYTDGTNRLTFEAFFKCNHYAEWENYVPINQTELFLISDLTVNPTTNNLVYVSYNNDTTIDFRHYNNLMTKYETYSYNLVVDKALSLTMNSALSDMLLVSYRTEKEQCILVLNDDFTVRKKYQDSLSEIEYVNYLSSEDGIIYLLATFENETTCYRKAELKINDENCYVNGKVIQGKQITTYDESIFGIYEVVYQYEINGEVFEIVRSIEVPLVININDKATYDVGIALEFNGKANLDYQPITSGYKVKTEGVHYLELIGNGKTEVYSFIVRKSSVEVGSETKENNIKVEVMKKTPIITDSNSSLNDMKIEFESIPLNTNGIYISLFLGLVGLAIGMILPLRRKR